MANEKLGPTLLTGHTGQVGSEVLKQQPGLLLSDHRLDKNLTDFSDFLLKNEPAVVINAAAYTKVDQAETDQATTRAVNVDAVEIITSACKTIGSRIVHFSTDYVFDGLKRGPYTENDICSPCNYYGMTKHCSESLCLSQATISGAIFRTSWVMGDSGNNFVTTLLRLGLERPTLQIIDDQIGRPTSSKLLAQAAIEVASAKKLGNRPCQVIHLSDDGEPVSWFQLAKYVLNRARDWDYPGIEAKDLRPISSEAYGQTARRPKNSILSCAMFDSLFDTQRIHWKHTIDSIIEEAAKNDWRDW